MPGRRPDLALGFWHAATVFVAREEFDVALDLIRSGCAARDAQRTSPRRFAVVGLHLLHGMVLAAIAARMPGAPAADMPAEARAELHRELSFEDSGNVYSRECCANAWDVLGVLALRENRWEAACAAFQEALTRVAGHPLATLGLHAASGHLLEVGREVSAALAIASAPDPLASVVDVATVHATALVLAGRHDGTARLHEAALEGVEPGPSGWLLPIEPLLNVQAHRGEWAQVLARLRHRAS